MAKENLNKIKTNENGYTMIILFCSSAGKKEQLLVSSEAR